MTNGGLLDGRQCRARHEPCRHQPSDDLVRAAAARRRVRCRRRVIGPHSRPAVTWIVFQLCLAIALLALWQGRRLGPLVAERLPVVVRASETVEGRGRLYRSRRARDRAADALRTATLQRMLPRLGLGQQRRAAGGRPGRRRSAADGTRSRWRTRCSVHHRPATTTWSTSPVNSTTSKGRSHSRDSATAHTRDPAPRRTIRREMRCWRCAPRSPRPSSARTPWSAGW